jgi:hypothetical protein
VEVQVGLSYANLRGGMVRDGRAFLDFVRDVAEVSAELVYDVVELRLLRELRVRNGVLLQRCILSEKLP